MRILSLLSQSGYRGLVIFLSFSAFPMLSFGTEPARVGDFSLLDAHGYFHSMSWYDDHRALVLLSHSSIFLEGNHYKCKKNLKKQ